MGEAKPTQGPWVADAFCTHGDHAVRIGTTDGTPHYYHRTTTLAECQYHKFNEDLDAGEQRISWKEAEANARVMAAAWDMLAALKVFVNGNAPSHRHALDQATAAIAKAEGRQP